MKAFLTLFSPLSHSYWCRHPGITCFQGMWTYSFLQVLAPQPLSSNVAGEDKFTHMASASSSWWLIYLLLDVVVSVWQQGHIVSKVKILECWKGCPSVSSPSTFCCHLLVVWQRTPSMTTLNKTDDITQPWCAPVFTLKLKSPWPMRVRPTQHIKFE